MIENMKEHTVIAKRQVIDYCEKVGGPLNVPIEKEILTSASSARQRYYRYQDDEKEKKRVANTNKKRKYVEVELSDLKLQRESLVSSAKNCREKADARQKDSETAGARGKFKEAHELNVESLSLRETAVNKVKEAESLDKAILAKENELKKF